MGSGQHRDEIGTLYVRGPHLMLGYWNRPDLIEQMLRPESLPGERDPVHARPIPHGF